GSDEIARQLRLLRNQGMEKRYANEVVGFNTRMTDIHAAIGRVQLANLAGWTAARQQNARFLSENITGVTTPKTAPDAEHVCHQCSVLVAGTDRDGCAAGLPRRGVGNGVYHPPPVHRRPPFGLSLHLPNTERAASQVLSLPVHPALTQLDLDVI